MLKYWTRDLTSEDYKVLDPLDMNSLKYIHRRYFTIILTQVIHHESLTETHGKGHPSDDRAAKPHVSDTQQKRID